MRNKVQLYIEGVRADLDESSFLLLNYTQEDLANPTVVKNSFSKTITLKGTPANDAIFGHIYRNDRNTLYGSPYNGPYFDPCRKTSFVLYNEAGEIIESGYLKLDSVEQTQRKRSYKVTLYGGLGSFLYGLSYDGNGDKLTLADLDFGETLDFTIDRDAVADAWARLDGNTSKDAKWEIVNFAPAYGGLPPSPFDANKILVSVYMSGLKGSIVDGNKTYTAPGGAAIVSLNDKVTGEDCREFRSYLQKPVLKMSALIGAICDPSNNGGWTVNLDGEFFDASNPYWADTWLTLPSLYDLNIDETTTETTQTLTGTGVKLPIVGGGGTGVYSVTVKALPGVNMMGVPPYDFKMWCRNSHGIVQNYLCYTLKLYDASQNEIASASYYLTTGGDQAEGFPEADFYFDHIDGTGAFVDADGNPVSFPVSAEAEGAAYYSLDWSVIGGYSGESGYYPGDMSGVMWQVGETVFATNFPFDPQTGSWDVVVKGTSTSTVRTGATVTQSALLGGGKTPADYLLSYCKQFGILMVAHKDTKTVDLVLRKNFYSGAVKDISGRIGRARERTKKPFAFDARWYVFGNEVKGEFAVRYNAKYSRNFGQFRVNTGYEFDAQEKPMTGGIVFGNLCSLTEASPFFCDLEQNGTDIPSVFLSGGTYNLFNGDDAKAVDLPSFTSAEKTWWDPSHPMHDFMDRIQLHGEQDAHIDERDTLVFFDGMADVSARQLSLTDDTERMLYLNGNKPCWTAVGGTPVTEVPKFSRYKWSGGSIVKSLDWGDPSEIQIPGVTVGSYSNVFDQFWAAYIGDRYDDDSAVVTAYVDLRGLQVNEDLFRDFYAFDGAVWALNRIIDHSLTTFGPTKCEFVKVQDTTNYTT